MDIVIYKKGVILEIIGGFEFHNIPNGNDVRVESWDDVNKIHIVSGIGGNEPISNRYIRQGDFKLSRRNKRKY